MIIFRRDANSDSLVSSFFWVSSSFAWSAAFSWDKVMSACSVLSIFFSAATRPSCSTFTSLLSWEIFSSALKTYSCWKTNSSISANGVDIYILKIYQVFYLQIVPGYCKQLTRHLGATHFKFINIGPDASNYQNWLGCWVKLQVSISFSPAPSPLASKTLVAWGLQYIRKVISKSYG